MTIPVKVAIASFLVALLIGALGWVAMTSLDSALSLYDERARRGAILRNLSEVFDSLQDAETAQRGYLLTEDPAFLGPLDGTEEKLQSAMNRLYSHVSGDAEAESLVRLHRAAWRKLQFIRTTLDIVNSQGFPEARSYVANGGGRIAMEEVREVIQRIRQIEAAGYDTTMARSEALSRKTRTALLIAIPSIAAAFVGFAIAFGFRVGLPLRAMAQSAAQIAKGDLDSPIITSKERDDEIGDLSRALEAMRVALRENRGLLIERNESLSRLNNQLQEMTRSKSEFLAMMSHEVRTPLNGLLGYSDLLANTTLDDTQRQYLETVRNSGRGLLRIVNDILDFSKIEAGKLTIESIPFAPRLLVTDVCRLFEFRARENGTEILSEIAPDVPGVMMGDETRVRQVLANLVSNAVKFTRGGQITVRVSNGSAAGMLRFQVRDTGIGIPKDKVDSLFQSFEQLDSSTARKYGGTGLGLAICQKLCTLMGGSIRLNSDVEQGAEFDFEVAVTLSSRQSIIQDEIDEKPDLDGVRVLIAEDNAVNASLLTLHLRRHHLDPTVVGDGAAAVTAAPVFDLIFMDIQMPVLDGLTATKRIRDYERSSGGRTYIIALTAETPEGEAGHYRDAGMDAYLPKPFRPRDLDGALARFSRFRKENASAS